MSRLLFTVEDTFYIQGRGLVPFPGIVPIENERFHIGDSLLLKRPDGTTVMSRIAGIEMMNPPLPNFAVVVLLKELTKDDVPIGTEVWSVDRDVSSTKQD